jgi:hypothetical protein
MSSDLLISCENCSSIACGVNKKQVLSEYFSKLGKKGGPKGGKARTAALTPEQRKELARKAAAKRWDGHEAKRPANKRAKKSANG